MNKQFSTLIPLLLYPKKRWLLFLDCISCGLLYGVFSQNLKDSALAYFTYALSFYSLVITLTFLYNITSKARGSVLQYYHRSSYYTNIQDRMRFKLYTSVSINIAYASFKLLIGCFYQSIWDIHLGIYYFILCMIRFILLRQVNYHDLGINKLQEYQKHQLCGYFLIVLNFILTGVVLLMVWRNYTYHYPGYMIYIVAMYTFYTTISAVVNGIKFRKYGSPLINAIHIITFITALVSLLSLQTAMLTQFGEESITQKQLANGFSGGIICMLIFLISLFMILNDHRKLKQLKATV